MSFFPAIHQDNHATALVEDGETYSYAALDRRIRRMAAGLLAGRDDLAEERVALFIPASLDYACVLHGIWRAGGIAVPLNVAATAPELAHYLGSAGVTRLVARDDDHATLAALCARLGVTLESVSGLSADASTALPTLAPERRAMMLFTSGTTDKPKGVVSTHANIAAQVTTLCQAWQWTTVDVIPLFLPVHHIHGIINVLSCALWTGATVHVYDRFDVHELTRAVAAGAFNVFMAVPTIYVKLIQSLESLEAGQAEAVCAGFRAMRLNISGSAACPVKLFDQWRDLTGQVLLERYGMTEIGMAISNPYVGERRAGHVGQPLPGVAVQLVDDAGAVVAAENAPGEIRVRGANVFLEYWDNPQATRDSFVDGWFCTGDMAVLEDGYYRIMGRTSIDIIKSGGYKLSALEIEGVLLTHEAIAEVAVIGVEDDTWGEAVAAVVVLRPGAGLDLAGLKKWCRQRLSAYKIPKILTIVDALPRNAMGKVTKGDLKTLIRE